jgi:hypothetical protein
LFSIESFGILHLNPGAVKNKLFFPFVVFLTLSFTSCKKEKDPAIIGNWVSISNYTAENGVFNWRTTSRFNQLISFNTDARFSTFVDIPTGAGTYSYDNRGAKIDLSYEADHYGTTARTVTYKIEELTGNRLVISSFSPAGNLQFKTEYVRND